MKIQDASYYFFDMDGLLFDTERLAIQIIMRKTFEQGFFLSWETYCKVTGCNYQEVLRLVYEEAGTNYPYPQIWEETEIELQSLAQKGKIPLKTGASSLLETLHSHNKVCWLVTSSHQKIAKSLLKHANLLHFFSGLTTGDQVANSKPNPDIYLKAMQEAKATPSESLAFEDSINGATAAISAEIPTIIIPDLLQPTKNLKKRAFYILESLEHFLNLFHNENISPWLAIDNAGKIFPSTSSARRTTLFRLSVILKKPIKIDTLQEALDLLLQRCPYYNVRLKAGIFWYYFERNKKRALLQPETKYPCMNFNIKGYRHHLFRVLPYKNRISVEFSHALTDGTGALEFTKALVAQYLELLEIHSLNKDSIIFFPQKVDPEEMEDAYKRYFNDKIPINSSRSKALHLHSQYLPHGQYRIITGTLDLTIAKRVAQELNCNLTEYFSAMLIDSYQTYYNELPSLVKKLVGAPIALRIPLNLRKLFPSKTMLNFFLAITAEIDPRLGNYSFQEIINIVRASLTTKAEVKNISQLIARNVRGEISPLTRILPLFIKNSASRLVYNHLGDATITTSFSNLGVVTLPKEYHREIENVLFYPPPNLINKINCSIITFNDKINISFGNLAASKKIERIFFTKLIQAGIPVLVQSNEKEATCPTVHDAE